MKGRGELIVVLGTRPEWIKLEPVIRALREAGQALRVVFTGQQQLGWDAMQDAGFLPEVVLAPVPSDPDPEVYAARLRQAVTTAVGLLPAAAVLVQGDTWSALAGAHAAQAAQLPLFHLEAGLRTHNPQHPWPEENIRTAIAGLACLHLAPTETARRNLLAEGVVPEQIVVTGNPVADQMLRHFPGRNPAPDTVLISCHRRENLGAAIRQLSQDVVALAGAYPGLRFVWLRHPNLPTATETWLRRHAPGHFQLIPPQDFGTMMALYAATCVLITDSGGMQEEALCAGLPTLIYREVTERPECVEMGVALLCPPTARGLIPGFAAARELNPLPRPDVYAGGRAAMQASVAIQASMEKVQRA